MNQQHTSEYHNQKNTGADALTLRPTQGGALSADRARMFERLILPHEQSLYGPALSLTRSASDAEDLVQETLLRAYDRFDTFRSDGSPRAWLHTIMRNLFFNAYRKKSREPKQVSLDVFEPATTGAAAAGVAVEADSASHAASTAINSPERIVLSQMEGAAVLAAVKALPAEYRQVVALADIQGLPYQEIADRLNIPVGTVRSRLSRGRDRVRKALFAWRPTEETEAGHAAPATVLGRAASRPLPA
jgi:RNA polymerase sigma-70 factor (ECF subfamily)